MRRASPARRTTSPSSRARAALSTGCHRQYSSRRATSQAPRRRRAPRRTALRRRARSNTACAAFSPTAAAERSTARHVPPAKRARAASARSRRARPRRACMAITGKELRTAGARSIPVRARAKACNPNCKVCQCSEDLTRVVAVATIPRACLMERSGPLGRACSRAIELFDSARFVPLPIDGWAVCAQVGRQFGTRSSLRSLRRPRFGPGSLGPRASPTRPNREPMVSSHPPGLGDLGGGVRTPPRPCASKRNKRTTAGLGDVHAHRRCRVRDHRRLPHRCARATVARGRSRSGPREANAEQNVRVTRASPLASARGTPAR